MTSVILKSIGLESVDPAIFLIILTVLIIVLFILLIVQSSRLSKIIKKYDRFMDGRDGDSMEEELISLFEDIRFLKKAQKQDSYDIASIKTNMVFAYQKVGIVRYDAFREMGGKLSFSIALLNDKNNGFLINSVHSSDGCYTYAKEIVGGESYIHLGNEEREALNKALGIDTHDDSDEMDENKPTPPKKESFKRERAERGAYGNDIKRRAKSPQKAPNNIEVDLEDLNNLGFEEF